MNGEAAGEGWADEDDDEDENFSARANGEEGKEREQGENGEAKRRERTGRWESGQGRCAVTGRKVLGGTEGLRRVIV